MSKIVSTALITGVTPGDQTFIHIPDRGVYTSDETARSAFISQCLSDLMTKVEIRNDHISMVYCWNTSLLHDNDSKRCTLRRDYPVESGIRSVVYDIILKEDN